MQILTQESLAAAVKKCQENEHYHVLVVREYGEDINLLLDYLLQVDGAAVTCCQGNSWVKFENGSYIHIISSACSSRGHRVDLVLCAEKLFYDEDVRYILQACESRNTSFQLKKNEV